MKRLTEEEIKLYELNILKGFDAYCKKHNIKYYLTYGSLLGAIRHKGFIPWDDDIDVAITRKEYNRLIELTKKEEVGPFYSFKSVETDSWDEPIGKIVDNRTSAYSDNAIGLWIDIFPLDYYDQKIHDKCFFYRRVLIAKKTKGLKLNSKKNIVKLLLKILFFAVPTKYIAKHMSNLSQGVKEKDYIGNTVFSGVKKDIISVNDLEQCEVEFEGYLFTTYKNYDVYLRQLYGDYMVLPPEEKRKGHSMEAFLV